MMKVIILSLLISFTHLLSAVACNQREMKLLYRGACELTMLGVVMSEGKPDMITAFHHRREICERWKSDYLIPEIEKLFQGKKKIQECEKIFNSLNGSTYSDFKKSIQTYLKEIKQRKAVVKTTFSQGDLLRIYQKSCPVIVMGQLSERYRSFDHVRNICSRWIKKNSDLSKLDQQPCNCLEKGYEVLYLMGFQGVTEYVKKWEAEREGHDLKIVSSSGREGNRIEKYPPVKIRVGKVEKRSGDGDLSLHFIRMIINRRRGWLKRCYRNVLKTAPKISGEIILQLSIHQDRRIHQIKVVSSTIKNRWMEGCVRKRIKRLYFPKFKGEKVEVSVPLKFNLK